MKKVKVLLIFIFPLLFFSIYNEEIPKEIKEKIRKVENSKDAVEIFKTSLWLYRRRYYQEFTKLFKKALEVDKAINKDKRKLTDILGYVKFEIAKGQEEDDEEEEFDEEEKGDRKSKKVEKDNKKSEKQVVYDTVTEKFKYLLKNLKPDETIFEEQIIKKSIAQTKLKQEMKKVGMQFDIKLISPHFILYTDIDLESSIKILDNLEAFYTTFYFFFYEALNIKKIKGKKITVQIFKDKKTYDEIVNKRYNMSKDNKSLELYYHLRKNDSSLFDIENKVSLATITVDEQLRSGKNIRNLNFVDFVMALPDIYKAVLENFLFTYIFEENKKYITVSQCLWLGLRTYFSYLIPGQVAFSIGSYVGGEPFFDITFTKEAIARKEIPTLKSLLTTNNFADTMNEFKKYEPQTFIRIYTTQCYSIIYYLFHKTNQAELEKTLKHFATPTSFEYGFFSKYIKNDEELNDFIVNNLQKELDKFKAK